jgi:putative transposase
MNTNPGGTRRPLRLPHYDYSTAGFYFLTICTHGRECLFGEVIGEARHLNAAGEVVAATWNSLPGRFPTIVIDVSIVMPNHFHGILALNATGASDRGQLPTLGAVVRAFKSIAAIGVNRALERGRSPVWQRGYHDHVIRDEASLMRHREYVADNPRRWSYDPENLAIHPSSVSG